MPWSCPVCGDSVLDDRVACSRAGCDGTKHDWTVGVAHTRQLVVGGARLEVLRGKSEDPRPAADVYGADAELAETGVAPALTKAAAQRLHREGRRPAPAHVVVVRATQSTAQKKLTLTVDFSQRASAEQSYPLQSSGYLELRFLFVYGADPDGFADVVFPGLELCDLSDGDGHAPSLELEAFKKRRELEVEAVDAGPPTILRVGPAATRLLHESPLCLPLEGAPHPFAALVRAAGHRVDHAPSHRLILIGHASSPGKASTNRGLSEARAQSLAHVIRGERDEWVDLATDRASLRDVKVYLAYLTRERGWSCDPGPLDEKNTSAAKAGVEAFQREFNQRRGGALDEDGKCGPETLGALFDVLEDELLRWLEKHGLRREDLALADPPLLACGETYAQSEQLPLPVSEETRRCVDVLLVPGAVPLEDAAIYSGEFPFQELALEDEPGEWERGRFLLVTDVDPKLDPAPDDRFTLRALDGSYARTLSTRADADRSQGGVDLLFDEVPTGARFELLSQPEGGEERQLFTDVAYAQLGRQSDYGFLWGSGEFELPEEV